MWVYDNGVMRREARELLEVVRVVSEAATWRSAVLRRYRWIWIWRSSCYRWPAPLPATSLWRAAGRIACPSMPGQTRYLMWLLRRSSCIYSPLSFQGERSANISAIVASRLNKKVLQLQNRGGTVQRHTLQLMVSDRRNGTTRARYVPETLGKSPSRRHPN